MTTQHAIYREMEQLIPASLWDQYHHLSFGEMAEVPACAEWAADLRRAERRWFEAET